jgi:hypothetical protein
LVWRLQSVADIMKTLLGTLLVASALSLGAFGCASNTADGAVASDAAMTARPKTIAATSEARYESLYGVWKVTGIQNDVGLDLSIIETGGGDPAMNGNLPLLAAYGPDHGEGGVFELGLNVRSIDTMTMEGADTIKLTGTSDNLDANDKTIQEPFTALIKLTLVDNNVQPSVAVTIDHDATETVAKSNEPATDFLYSLYSVDTKESPAGNIVRLFETGRGGDPAMNGGQLVVNIMSFPESEHTFDLGLSINEVKSFTVTDTGISIEGIEDVMNDQGDIVQRPFGYGIQYSVKDGEVAPSITMTRFK